MERIQEEESLTLPPDIDYLSLPVSLSDEVREVLARARPDTVSVKLITFCTAFLYNHDLYLSAFTVEILTRKCFQLGAATRLPGVTPAAIVHLLNYVSKMERKAASKRTPA